MNHEKIHRRIRANPNDNLSNVIKMSMNKLNYLMKDNGNGTGLKIPGNSSQEDVLRTINNYKRQLALERQYKN